MGLSNYIPSSRIAQSGVCTSSTRPATPYEGQMIYETDTNRVLVYDNTAWVMIADTDQPPGLQLTGTATLTGQTTVQINNCFSSSFNKYKFVYNLRVSGGTSGIYCRLSASGTPNSTAASYVQAGRYVGFPTVGAGDFNAASDAFGLSFASTFPCAGDFTVVSPAETLATSFTGSYMNLNAAVYTGGYHNQNVSYDGLYVFATSSVLPMYGSISVYGLKD